MEANKIYKDAVMFLDNCRQSTTLLLTHNIGVADGIYKLAFQALADDKKLRGELDKHYYLVLNELEQRQKQKLLKKSDDFDFGR